MPAAGGEPPAVGGVGLRPDPGVGQRLLRRGEGEAGGQRLANLSSFRFATARRQDQVLDLRADADRESAGVEDARSGPTRSCRPARRPRWSGASLPQGVTSPMPVMAMRRFGFIRPPPVPASTVGGADRRLPLRDLHRDGGERLRRWIPAVWPPVRAGFASRDERSQLHVGNTLQFPAGCASRERHVPRQPPDQFQVALHQQAARETGRRGKWSAKKRRILRHLQVPRAWHRRAPGFWTPRAPGRAPRRSRPGSAPRPRAGRTARAAPADRRTPRRAASGPRNAASRSTGSPFTLAVPP